MARARLENNRQLEQMQEVGEARLSAALARAEEAELEAQEAERARLAVLAAMEEQATARDETAEEEEAKRAAEARAEAAEAGMSALHAQLGSVQEALQAALDQGSEASLRADSAEEDVAVLLDILAEKEAQLTALQEGLQLAQATIDDGDEQPNKGAQPQTNTASNPPK